MPKLNNATWYNFHLGNSACVLLPNAAQMRAAKANRANRAGIPK